MEIESVFGNMLKQVAMIGKMCRENFQEARIKIESLEDKSNLVEEALNTLVNKDQEITNMMKNQSTFNNSISKALSWLKSSYDSLQETMRISILSTEQETKMLEDIQCLQNSCSFLERPFD